MQKAKLNRSKLVTYLQDNEFMGFVEQIGAEEIKRSARNAGYQVEDCGYFFNVVYKRNVMVVAK